MNRQIPQSNSNQTVKGSDFKTLKEIGQQLVEQQREAVAELKALNECLQQFSKRIERLEIIEGYREQNNICHQLRYALGFLYGVRVQDQLGCGYLRDIQGNAMKFDILGSAVRCDKSDPFGVEARYYPRPSRIGEFLRKLLKPLFTRQTHEPDETVADDSSLLVIGEIRPVLSCQHIDEFLDKRLNPIREIQVQELFPILVAYTIASPEVEEYANERNIALTYPHVIVRYYD